MPRIAAVDYGTKRIGLAISDDNERIALPLKMIEASNIKQAVHDVLLVLLKYAPRVIVVGLPLMMNGRVGLMAEAARLFAAELKKQCSCQVELLDERLTSAQAERALKDLSYSRKGRVKLVDSTAASMILQTYLEQNMGKTV
jgi:putative holliday junction resolvase